MTRLPGGYAYAFWALGVVVAALTILQQVRAGGPRFQMPRLTGAHVSTLVAWLIIVISVVFALSRIHG